MRVALVPSEVLEVLHPVVGEEFGISPHRVDIARAPVTDYSDIRRSIVGKYGLDGSIMRCNVTANWMRNLGAPGIIQLELAFDLGHALGHAIEDWVADHTAEDVIHDLLPDLREEAQRHGISFNNIAVD